MKRKIVVAVDKGDDARKLLDWAWKTVITKEDSCVALYAMPEKSMFGLGTFILDEYWGRIQKEELEAAEKVLQNLRIEADRIGMPLNTETRPGAAQEVLVDYCKMIKADLLIMGRESQQPMLGLGSSVSTHCIAHAPCPVLVARSGTT